MRYNGFTLLFVVSLVAAIGMGCVSSGPTPPQDAMDAANVTADRMFNALNTGDHIAFTQNFSPTMKAAVNESYFNSMTGSMAKQYGKYVSRAPVPAASVVGNYNVFVYECQFEKTRLNLQLTMNKSDIRVVEGFFYR